MHGDGRRFPPGDGEPAPWAPDGDGHHHPLQSTGLNTSPYHLTQRFLGPVDADRIPPLTAALGEVAAQSAPFSLRLGDPDTFPDRGGVDPKIAWIGVLGQTEELAALPASVDHAVECLGFDPPGFAFLPHVTVGRCATDNQDQCRAMADFWRGIPSGRSGALPYDEIALYASERDQEGKVTYVIQDSWPLGSLA